MNRRPSSPYQGLFEKVPEGIFEQIQEVTCVRDGEIELASGKCIPYAYLAIATGATQSPPAKLLASQKGEAGAELRVLQARVEKAEKIAIVGGGVVGVQLLAGIKSFYRDKTVVLIHSRDQLLLNFGMRLPSLWWGGWGRWAWMFGLVRDRLYLLMVIGRVRNLQSNVGGARCLTWWCVS